MLDFNSFLNPNKKEVWKTNVCLAPETTSLTQTNNDEDIPAKDFSEINPKPEKEWIWVNGYRGFNEQWINGKLELTGRNDFVYNQNGETSIKEDEDENNLKECKSGLHFCTELKNVFEHYSPFVNNINESHYIYSLYNVDRYITSHNTVFAEVEAEVEKEYYEKNKDNEKLVARKIRIIKILSNEEVFEQIQLPYSYTGIGYTIETEEEYNYIKTVLHDFTVNNPSIEHEKNKLKNFFEKTTREMLQKKKANQFSFLVENGYSPTFARIIVDEYGYAFNDAVAYADEGLSPDMRAYLIVNKKNPNT